MGQRLAEVRTTKLKASKRKKRKCPPLQDSFFLSEKFQKIKKNKKNTFFLSSKIMFFACIR